eukprot:2129443-Pleurochrysis_carterae.AAC.2
MAMRRKVHLTRVVHDEYLELDQQRRPAAGSAAKPRFELRLDHQDLVAQDRAGPDVQLAAACTQFVPAALCHQIVQGLRRLRLPHNCCHGSRALRVGGLHLRPAAKVAVHPRLRKPFERHYRLLRCLLGHVTAMAAEAGMNFFPHRCMLLHVPCMLIRVPSGAVEAVHHVVVLVDGLGLPGGGVKRPCPGSWDRCKQKTCKPKIKTV